MYIYKLFLSLLLGLWLGSCNNSPRNIHARMQEDSKKDVEFREIEEPREERRGRQAQCPPDEDRVDIGPSVIYGGGGSNSGFGTAQEDTDRIPAFIPLEDSLLDDIKKCLRSERWDYQIDLEKLQSLGHIQQPIILALQFGKSIILDKEGVIRETTHDWYLTPKNSGKWNYKRFNAPTCDRIISHMHPNNGTGVLNYAIDGLYGESREPKHFDAIIISLGMNESLGVNEEVVPYLNTLVEGVYAPNKSLTEYYILPSREVPGKQLELLQKGYKVGVLLHVTC